MKNNNFYLMKNDNDYHQIIFNFRLTILNVIAFMILKYKDEQQIILFRFKKNSLMIQFSIFLIIFIIS